MAGNTVHCSALIETTKMPAKSVRFDNGVAITTQDKETIRYEDGGKVALVWVDHESGFFKRGRIIRLSSLQHWKNLSSQDQAKISDEDQRKIIEMITRYLHGVPVQVEDDR